MKTAVLIHGYHLGTTNWEEVVWGNPAHGVYGRAPAGLREALRLDAEVLFFPTGASERDGLLEGEFALKMARERIAEVPEFAERTDRSGWLEKRAVLELKSQSTAEELLACAHLAVERGIERLVLVSSPTHIIRAHKTAIEEFSKDEKLKPLLHALYAIASDTSYAGASIGDVVTIEPPHRPDRLAISFNETLKGLIPLIHREDIAKDLNDALKKVIEDYKNKP